MEYTFYKNVSVSSVYIDVVRRVSVLYRRRCYFFIFYFFRFTVQIDSNTSQYASCVVVIRRAPVWCNFFVHHICASAGAQSRNRNRERKKKR